MTTFTSTFARLLTAAAMALLLTIALSSSTNAQPCFCDHITVVVDPSVGCPIVLYPAAPLCRFHPVTVNPGDRPAQIACCEDMSLTIQGCNGSSITFIQGGPTSFFNFAIQPGCCVNAVLTQDPRTGCLTISITPARGICAC